MSVRTSKCLNLVRVAKKYHRQQLTQAAAASSTRAPTITRSMYSGGAVAGSSPSFEEGPIQPSSVIRSFSGAAAMESDVKTPRRRVETKDPIVLTQRAADRIKELLEGESAAGALGIRLGVKRRGCNGLSYTLNYAFEKPKKDIEMEAFGVNIFIEPMALFNVVGTTMDWEENELASEFTFNNPNSKGECGCGESFTV